MKYKQTPTDKAMKLYHPLYGAKKIRELNPYDYLFDAVLNWHVYGKLSEHFRTQLGRE